MSERKLATIRMISEILPIDGADAIELAVVDGWKVVIKKGEYKTGDICVYCEVDSFLPIRDEFEFLRKSSYKKLKDGTEGFRLKTIKLRGQISQGLILPLEILEGEDEMKLGFSQQPHGLQFQLGPWDNAFLIEIGADVTKLLGITKYEPPIPAELAGKAKGNFPAFLRKTDEERCLSEDSMLTTEEGPMTIKDICETKYTGKVLSYNPKTDENEMNYVNNYSIQNNNNDWYEIELESGKIIKATGNHLIWLHELKCFREIRELLGGEIVKVN